MEVETADVRRIELADVEGVRWLPEVASGVGALVLAGSSGRVDEARVELLARTGALAESIRWFGGPGQHDGPWEIPIELFLDRVHDLARDCDRVVLLGTSFGAEAALVTAVVSAEVTAAAIAVERTDQVVLAAGGDDRVWPSRLMAEAISQRRHEHGLDTVLVSDPAAGHRTVLPGEAVVTTGMRMQRGGTQDADRRLGVSAWAHIRTLLSPVRVHPPLGGD